MDCRGLRPRNFGKENKKTIETANTKYEAVHYQTDQQIPLLQVRTDGSHHFVRDFDKYMKEKTRNCEHEV